MSQQQIQPAQDFEDERSVTAKRYQQSLTQTKPELLAHVLKCAMRNGFEADAWFDNKPVVGQTCDLT